MRKKDYCNGRDSRAKKYLAGVLLTCLLLSSAISAQATQIGEKLDGFYSRQGNNGSPAEAAGNNIYIKFFEDRWVAMLFVPYPYAVEVEPKVVEEVFQAARARTGSAAFLRNKFGLLDEAATVQLERYGYLGDRLAFECGALSACTIRMGDEFLELVKPGVINEHIIRYDHVGAD